MSLNYTFSIIHSDFKLPTKQVYIGRYSRKCALLRSDVPALPRWESRLCKMISGRSDRKRLANRRSKKQAHLPTHHRSRICRHFHNVRLRRSDGLGCALCVDLPWMRLRQRQKMIYGRLAKNSRPAKQEQRNVQHKSLRMVRPQSP